MGYRGGGSKKIHPGKYQLTEDGENSYSDRHKNSCVGSKKRNERNYNCAFWSHLLTAVRRTPYAFYCVRVASHLRVTKKVTHFLCASIDNYERENNLAQKSSRAPKGIFASLSFSPKGRENIDDGKKWRRFFLTYATLKNGGGQKQWDNVCVSVCAWEREKRA